MTQTWVSLVPAPLESCYPLYKITQNNCRRPCCWTISSEIASPVFDVRIVYTKSYTPSALMAKITASGTAEWVRSNLARELPI